MHLFLVSEPGPFSGGTGTADGQQLPQLVTQLFRAVQFPQLPAGYPSAARRFTRLLSGFLSGQLA